MRGIALPGPSVASSNVSDAEPVTPHPVGGGVLARLKDLYLYPETVSVLSLMESQVLGSTNGLRRHRPVFGVVICWSRTRRSFYLTT